MSWKEILIIVIAVIIITGTIAAFVMALWNNDKKRVDIGDKDNENNE